MHYKQAAVERSLRMPRNNGGTFLQCVTNNIDHSQVTLSGKDAFHGMGVISITADGLIK